MGISPIIVRIAFFFSGLCALSLEVLWTRMLSFVFGGTSLAITTILTTYMAGLAWGSWVGGRVCARLRDPLKAYAWIEIAVGVWALWVPLMLLPLPGLHRLFALHGGSSAWALGLFRFVLAFAILLLPTFLMGATLPLLSQAMARRQLDPSREVGWLYSVNTLGAVAGCLLTGFVLLPRLGTRWSLWGIAALGIATGLLVWAWSQRSPAQPAHSPKPEADAPEWSPTGKEQKLMLLIFAAAGGLSMVCQVAWSRVLSMVIGSSSYAFTLVLSTFLIGLGLGSSLGTALLAKLSAKRAFATLLMAIAGAVLGGALTIDQLPLAFFYLSQKIPLTVGGLFAIKAALAAAVILAPTLMMGALFPLAVACVVQERGPIGRSVGEIYGYNTIGAIAGSFGAGFGLLPWIGTQGALHLVVVGYVVLGASMLFLQGRRDGSSWLQGGLGLASLLALALLSSPWDTHRLSLGLFRVAQLERMTPQQLRKKVELVSFEEGLSATVTVERHGRHIALKINGKTDASTGLDMPTQILSGLLPASLHPKKPQDGLLIGWGSGVSAGALLQFPLRSLTALEIEPAVVRGARAFRPWNHHPQSDRRLQLYLNDGRNFLATQSRQYDLLISEPSNPWLGGVSALFTLEFFRLARARLKDDGVFCQWVQLYELSPRNIRALFRTVMEVFPHAYVFSPSHDSRDSLLIALKSRADWRLRDLQRRSFVGQPKVRQEYLRAGLHSALDLLPRWIGGPEALKQLVRGAPLNTDDNGLVEFRAPLELLTHVQSDGKAWLRRALQPTPKKALKLFQVGAKEAGRSGFRSSLALAYLRYGDARRARQMMAALPQRPSTREGKGVMALLFGPQAIARCLKRRRQETLLSRVRCGVALGLPDVPTQTLGRWLKGSKDDAMNRLVRGSVHFVRRRWSAGLRALAPLSRRPEILRKYPGICYLLARMYRRQKVWPEAVWFSRLYLRYRARGGKP